ncbi:MAG: hypothetical protein KKC39_03275 [Candidatus Omnitrophica bacterium]|nr:hypothetical protein [Candidatus Omnitrophota bacterium]MBU4467750.1 hypothetical protein [Candidatus Omnitrophota bacterium]MCG2708023.1 hypothetical protein [Candidatus Omnitrophota bacterium]
MEKVRSLGIAIISRFEVIVGTIGLFISIPFIIFEWLDELNRVHVGNEDYVGFGVVLILGIVSGMILIAGKFTYRLNPIGRILNLILAYGLVILYILFFSITVRSTGFYPYFKDVFLIAVS